jgi:hypothetical protein
LIELYVYYNIYQCKGIFMKLSKKVKLTILGLISLAFPVILAACYGAPALPDGYGDVTGDYGTEQPTDQ